MNSSRIKHDVQKIFELWCEVSTEEPVSDANQNHQSSSEANPMAAAVNHQVVARFPEQFNDTRVLADIPHFAFPCDLETTKTMQPYSFVLTCTDSKFRFGFCHHEPATKTAYVLITYLPWHDIFYKFLNVLVELRKRNVDDFNQALQFVYNSPIPRQGTLKVNYDQGENVFVFQSPPQFQLPSIPENRNLNLYYNFVEPKNMIAIFAAMLNERRVIFTSRRLDILSSCIQAANHFLTPLCWQHIFIPVLPMRLKDFLLAPMPFLIGVPEQVLRTVRRDEIGEVVILHCDSKVVETPFDDVKDFPAELVAQLKKQLSNPAEHYGDRVSRIFLRVMVQLIGGYRDAVRYPDGGKITWDSEAFVETRPSALRPYLRKMIDLQIFNQFIDERLEMLNGGFGVSDEFIVEMQRFDPSKSGKNYKEFLKNVKEKTNPAMKSAVKSVKEGGKGVKTAYKDLKSKLKNNHAGSSKFHAEENNNNHHTSSFTKSREQRRSAPSSPVFNKGPPRSTSSAASSPYNAQSMHISMQPSSSSTMPTGNSNYANTSAATSPGSGSQVQPLSGSTSSSSSMSEINLQLWQELQHHDLFKSPPVDRSLKTGVVNDAALRPPTTMAPPVPSKKKVSIPSVFLVDENKAIPGNGTATGVRTVDRPPPRPLRPPPVMGTGSGGGGGGGGGAQMKCNTLNLSSSHSSLSPPQPPGHGSSQSQSQSLLSHHNPYLAESGQKQQMPQPHPPPRRHQMGGGGGGGPLVTSGRGGGGAELQSKCLSVQDNASDGCSSYQSEVNEVDLIKLDTSIELEDFDPLNRNAKPIPSHLPTPAMPVAMGAAVRMNGTMTSGVSNSSSSSSSAIPGVGGFNNPLYPYFEPPFMSSSPQNAFGGGGGGGDDDTALLRKYGLDQLTLDSQEKTQKTSSTISGGATTTTLLGTTGIGNGASAASAAEATRSNWTTFE